MLCESFWLGAFSDFKSLVNEAFPGTKETETFSPPDILEFTEITTCYDSLLIQIWPQCSIHSEVHTPGGEEWQNSRNGDMLWHFSILLLHICRDRSRSRRRSHVAPSDSWFVGSGAAEAGEWFHSTVFLLTVINVTMVEDEQTLQMVLHKSEFEGQTWLPCQPRYGCRPCASRKKAGPCVAVVNLGDAWMTLDTLQIDSKNLLAKLLLRHCATEQCNTMQQSVGTCTQNLWSRPIVVWVLAGPNAETSRMARRKEEKDEKDEKRLSHGPQCHFTCLGWFDWFCHQRQVHYIHITT